ncbi:NUDIX domain-containing protein [Paenibacillus albidus]|uniref:NUDIX hydrolase n=1 Tax=Paenibacillus albidus TaxID=2041023 RepID=UPI001BEAF5C2|nr:NUDIX domain-containing protein [Paenibacillus albidus]MBT2292702.1 NUDIX domain-containing protein [Paenibacillus albidus]
MQLLRRITDSDFIGGAPEFMETISRYASRGVLVDDKMHIAMMYMSKINLYKFPGGGIDEGEEIRDAFLREIKEETGYEAEIICELGYVEEHKNKNNFMQHSYCFVAKVHSRVSNSMLTESEVELGMIVEWMTFEKALEALNSSEIICDDYSTQFMIVREKAILEKAVEVLANQYGRGIFEECKVADENDKG